MSRLPRVSGRDVVRALRRANFQIAYARGSHFYMKRPGTRSIVCVPVHGTETLALGTLGAILDQAGLSAEELADLLRG